MGTLGRDMTDDHSPDAPAADPEDEDPTWLLDLEEDLRRVHEHLPQPPERRSLLHRILGR